MKFATSLIAFALAGSFASIHVLAQSASDYPKRGIVLVMPLAAGSAGDVLGRLVAVGMAKQLGTHIVSENVTGASGAIGIDRVLRPSRTAIRCWAPATTSSSTHRYSIGHLNSIP